MELYKYSTGWKLIYCKSDGLTQVLETETFIKFCDTHKFCSECLLCSDEYVNSFDFEEFPVMIVISGVYLYIREVIPC